MSGINTKGLTVVISPLQSLMKDQVDNLEKLNITDAVTINGLLDSIKKAKALERVENGSASILYISPESLRSKTIERLLLGRTIFVSTIHKAKGREFDNVFLMLDQFTPGTNEAKRQLYVAMTRAKHNLTLYDNRSYLDSIKAEGMQVVLDSQTYLPPQELVMQLSHRDVQLDFFLYYSHLIKELKSGWNHH